MLADIDDDGDIDIVGFGNDEVKVGLNNGNGLNFVIRLMF